MKHPEVLNPETDSRLGTAIDEVNITLILWQPLLLNTAWLVEVFLSNKNNYQLRSMIMHSLNGKPEAAAFKKHRRLRLAVKKVISIRETTSQASDLLGELGIIHRRLAL